MKKIIGVILLAALTIATFAGSFTLAAGPLFTFYVPVNLVNIPGSIGPLCVFVNLFDNTNKGFVKVFANPPELNVTSGVINFNKTVMITIAEDQLNGHKPEEAIKYNVGISRATDGMMLSDLMAQSGPNPYDTSKPFFPYYLGSIH